MTLKPYGAFVDIGGIQGMVHISEISHQRIEDPKEVLTEGQTVRVRVMRVQPDPKHSDRKRVGLSIRALLGDPWEEQSAILTTGTVVEGSVVRIQPFGAFVQIAPGIDGLVHISELADRHIKNPSEVVSVGETVKATVLNVDWASKRISLSLRSQEQGEPGEELRAGSMVDVIVDGVKPFGLFVRIPSQGRRGRGFIPAEETGLAKGANLRRSFPEGKEFKAMVLEIEADSGKIRLSIKAGADQADQENYRAFLGKSGNVASGAGASQSGGGSFGTLGDALQLALKKGKK